jgi:archaemetzincin
VKPIQLVPLGGVDPSLISELRDALEDTLRLPVAVHPLVLDLKPFYSQQRVQYNSTEILQALGGLMGTEDKTLAVIEEDLFIPILTFVFGEAQLDGSCAVVSSHRLRNARYGLPPDPTKEFSRLLKEAVHELGHTFGLVHCSIPDCVMRASTYVEDIDLKGVSFCTSCRALLEAHS